MSDTQLFLKYGKFHLSIAGVIVATQGDPCRDLEMREKFGKERWDVPAMEELKARIEIGG